MLVVCKLLAADDLPSSTHLRAQKVGLTVRG